MPNFMSTQETWPVAGEGIYTTDQLQTILTTRTFGSAELILKNEGYHISFQYNHKTKYIQLKPIHSYERMVLISSI